MTKPPRILKWFEREACDLGDFPVSLTKQQFEAECDINNIVDHNLRVKPGAEYNQRPAMFGDFTAIPNYQQAMDELLAARSAFESLPSRARASFDNDPAQFMEFAADPNNIEQMRLWGLAKPAAETPPAAATEAAGGSSPPNTAGTPQPPPAS